MPPKRKATAASSTGNDDYSKLKVAELKELCRSRGLDSKGTKAKLLQLLNDCDADSALGGKKIKSDTGEVEEKEEKLTMKDKLNALAAADKAKKKLKMHSIDSNCRLSNKPDACIEDDYNCMLNQTNIGHNNNKFYVIQLIQKSGSYFVYNRWGRVGEVGQDATKGPLSLDNAIKEFEKKFKDKTKNDWSNRDHFVPSPGKYTLLEIEGADETDFAEMDQKLQKLEKSKSEHKACSLVSKTKELIDLIFNEDMFKEAMQDMNIDVKKMPLGKLSKSQIAKGFEVLEQIEEVLEKGSKGGLEQLTSTFYTLIPHNFGRQRPPVITDKETLRKKMDMLLVLGDIEIAQSLKVEAESQEQSQGDELPLHPSDINYGLLCSDLELLPQDSKEFKILETNFKATGQNSWNSCKLNNIWKVNRRGEGDRFAAHEEIANRKLLWHGTNVAVVVAILKGGLRIMPHSGGRVGRGIYFASQCSKSLGYVNPSRKGVGIMFLNEVALGKEHSITRDNSSLTSAPNGFDSVVARGRTEPDPSKDTQITLDGKKVIVPQGQPKDQPQYKNSSFWESEYLVYKESQARIRYLLSFKM